MSGNPGVGAVLDPGARPSQLHLQILQMRLPARTGDVRQAAEYHFCKDV